LAFPEGVVGLGQPDPSGVKGQLSAILTDADGNQGDRLNDPLRLHAHQQQIDDSFSKYRKSHVLGEPAEQPFGVLAEMVVSVKTLIRFLDPQQFLFLRSQGIEDRLTIALGVDEEIPTKLRHHRGHFDMLRKGQRRFFIEAKARKLANALVQSTGCFFRVEVQVVRSTLDKCSARNDIEQDQGLDGRDFRSARAFEPIVGSAFPFHGRAQPDQKCRPRNHVDILRLNAGPRPIETVSVNREEFTAKPGG
jgi:hypothetical protein